MLTFTVQLYIYRLKIKSKLQICNNLILNNYLFSMYVTSPFYVSAPATVLTLRLDDKGCDLIDFIAAPAPLPPTTQFSQLCSPFAIAEHCFFLCFMELIENE